MKKKKQLILIISDLMNDNKKKDRQEHTLIRMSSMARNFMGFENDQVELYPSDKNTSDRLKGAVMLDIYKAYTQDLKKLKTKNLSEEDLKKVGFVTETTFKRITQNNNKINNIWISDGINDSVLGSDPEFVLKNKINNKIIYANNLLNYEDILGSDGPMAELRPDPAITPKELITNIKNIFKTGISNNNINYLQWLAGCFYKTKYRSYKIGGHIHIGTPIQIIKAYQYDNLTYFFYCLNKILDELIGIPLTKLDGITKSIERRKGYGYFGELRTVNSRLEYRTLSGTWLSHPLLAEAVIGTVKAIVNEVYEHIINNKLKNSYIKIPNLKCKDLYYDTFNSWGDIGLANDMRCTCSTIEVKNKINKPCVEDMKTIYIKKWYDKMKSLSTYNKYSKYIDFLFDTLLLSTATFSKFSMDLQHNWLEDGNFSPAE